MMYQGMMGAVPPAPAPACVTVTVTVSSHRLHVRPELMAEGPLFGASGFNALHHDTRPKQDRHRAAPWYAMELLQVNSPEPKYHTTHAIEVLLIALQCSTAQHSAVYSTMQVLITCTGLRAELLNLE